MDGSVVKIEGTLMVDKNRAGDEHEGGGCEG